MPDTRSRGTNCHLNCPGRSHSTKTKTDKHGKNKQRSKNHYRRKRLNLIYKQEEIYHEPYMNSLYGDFYPSTLCDSKIEFPWNEIAVMPEDLKLRSTQSTDEKFSEIAKKESTGKMKLPWKDLIIEEVLTSVSKNIKKSIVNCDSSLEIPWSDLVIEKPVNIQPVPKEKPCPREDIEVPWDAILVPRNIIIESKRKKHPSSKLPRRTAGKATEDRWCKVDCRGNDKDREKF